MYRQTKVLHFDGEDVPLEFSRFRQLMTEFRSINEFKYDRLVFDHQNSLSSLNKIEFKHLNKLIVERRPTVDTNLLAFRFLDMSTMFNLRYIRCPQLCFPTDPSLYNSLETIVLTDCEHLDFDFLRFYVNLRLVKLDLLNLNRLLESRAQLLLDFISSIYANNKSIAFVQLVCASIHPTKIQLFVNIFKSQKFDDLIIKSTDKHITIHRLDRPSTDERR